MGRTKHVYAHPGQHVWVHRPHTPHYNSSSDGDGWITFLKILGIVAAIGAAIWVISYCWEIIVFVVGILMLCRILGIKTK